MICNICNGAGSTYKHHGYGLEFIPCNNEVCRERNLRESELGRIRRDEKRAEIKRELNIA